MIKNGKKDEEWSRCYQVVYNFSQTAVYWDGISITNRTRVCYTTIGHLTSMLKLHRNRGFISPLKLLKNMVEQILKEENPRWIDSMTCLINSVCFFFFFLFFFRFSLG